MRNLLLRKGIRVSTLSLLFAVVSLLYGTPLSAQSISKIRHFDTWNGGIIKSSDPAGITFHTLSGRLYIADSEINELPVFVGDNIFEVSLRGDQVFREIESNNSEPTGITYNQFDGFFYVTNDDTQLLSRYDSNLNNPLASVNTSDALPDATDPEGVTSDPGTGMLYVADGKNGGCQILIYDSDLIFQGSWDVNQFGDPEGIAFNPDNGHLYVVSSQAMAIFEFTVNGTFITSYDISGFSPAPIAPQGLTFAPTSDPNDPPGDLAIYVADAMVDNFEDGRIYEADFSSQPPIVITLTPQNPPVVIPANGGAFTYDLQLTNTTTSTQTAQVWNKILTPSGGLAGPTVGPVTANLSPGQVFTITLTQEVPSRPPPGNYTYRFNVGTFPNVVKSKDSFIFTKSSTAPALADTEDEEWSVFPNSNLYSDFAQQISTQSNGSPQGFSLGKNYPNPFNPTTTIEYHLPQSERVTITIFDITGQRVRELVNEYRTAGKHLARWDGKNENGKALASGIYLYRMKAGRYIESKQMTLVK